MPRPVIQVCGPISTGGLGSIEKNVEVLAKTIQKLESKGYHVFSQVPFENAFERIKKKYTSREEGDKALLTEFYLTLFKTGIIESFFFIHGWQSSSGAKWEHEKAELFSIKINYLPKDFLENK